jgi:hypothetical protein
MAAVAAPGTTAKRPAAVISLDDDGGSLQTDMFCCPVCTMHYGSTILQCKNGCCICEGCWKALTAPRLCPSCRVSMAQTSNCLFALQTARAAGNKIQCAAGCGFTGSYDKVCEHERTKCATLHKKVPCLTVQILAALGLPNTNPCKQELAESDLVKGSLGHHAEVFSASATAAGKYATFRTEIPMRPHTRCVQAGVKHDPRGHFLLYSALQDQIWHIAFVCLDRDTIPAGQARFQINIRRAVDDAEHGSGLRLEGKIITAKELLQQPVPIQLHSSAIHVHEQTLVQYVRGAGTPNEHYKAVFRW